MDKTREKIALLALAKGRDMPAFLASLGVMDRLYTVQAMNEYRSLGPNLYQALLRFPEKLVDAGDERWLAELDKLGEKARQIIATWDAVTAAQTLIEAIMGSIGTEGGDSGHVPVHDAQQDTSPDMMMPQPTATTNIKSLEQIRQAGMAGLN